MIDVLGIGVAAVDDLVHVDHYPAPDTKMRVPAMERHGGGLTATALVAAARLGVRAAYCAHLGDDELSRFTIAELEREGVDCSRILYQAGARPFHAVIIVDRSTGSRTILFEGEGVTHLQPGEIRAEWIAECRVFLFDHYAAPAALPVVALARAHGVPIVADVEDENAPGVRDLLPQIDHLIVGIELAARLSGDSDPARMVRSLAGRHVGRACLAVTAGTRGCWYAEAGRGEVHHLPAFRVQTVDTTGCGDVFHGAYAAALACGAEPRQAIRLASATAALKATRPGGRAGIPDRAMLDRFLVEHIDEDHVIPA